MRQNLKEPLKMAALPARSSPTKVIHDLQRKLSSEPDGSLIYLEIFISFVSIGWVPSFDVPTLHCFTKCMTNAGQNHDGQKKYLQGVIASACFGPIKKPRYSFDLIKRTDGSESDALFGKKQPRLL